jgi:hypothetical protein
MAKCLKCQREFKKLSSKVNHEKTCDGSGMTKKERGKLNQGKSLKQILKEKGTYDDFCKTISSSLKKIHGSPLKEEDRIKKKEKLRNIVLKRYEEGWDPKCGRCKKYSYLSPIAGEVKLDGLWELKVAKYLDEHKINWKRNLKRFGYVNSEGYISTYKPDFYIDDWKLYLEIKGYETKLDRIKWGQFKEPLLIWRKEDLKRLNILGELQER